LNFTSPAAYILAQQYPMPANAVVRAIIDAKTKAEATVVLAVIGLTVSDAFRL
jgi:RelB antitoxin